MTDTEAALLRAIADYPDEDTPRLAYADFLDEQGGETAAARAEYIRIQIRRQRGLADKASDAELYRREVELYVAHAATWRLELPAGYEATVVACRRGFWHRAGAAPAAVLAAADDPLAHLIDELTLTSDPGPHELREMLKLPHVRELVALVLRGAIPVGFLGARVLADSDFPRLVRLGLGGQHVGDAGVRLLCASPSLPRLRELDLALCNITDAGADILLNSALLPRLRRLNLWNNPISPAAARRLAARFTGILTGLTV
jgi:uncharacterized protein (TIGR02996 family)